MPPSFADDEAAIQLFRNKLREFRAERKQAHSKLVLEAETAASIVGLCIAPTHHLKTPFTQRIVAKLAQTLPNPGGLSAQALVAKNADALIEGLQKSVDDHHRGTFRHVFHNERFSDKMLDYEIAKHNHAESPYYEPYAAAFYRAHAELARAARRVRELAPQCLICLSDDQEPFFFCGNAHAMHKRCARLWIKRSGACPLCKDPIRPFDLK
jgi:hypothetical protein